MTKNVIGGVTLGLLLCSSVVPVAVSVPDRALVLHVLNRVGFGPRAGDIERVQALGIERYIDQQLHPERIPDAAMDARLSGLETLGLSSQQIAEQFEQPVIQARRAQREAQRDQPAATGAPDAQMARPRPGGPQQAANSVVLELSEQKLLRAIYSERQLQEVLMDFWFNHFNVDARKGRVRFMLTEYEREAIRPHVLGRFRDLLGATAKSPAMLFYLDNFMSADPDASGHGRRQTRPGRAGGRRPAQSMPPAGAEPHATGAQRELRARADGAPHPRRRRRLLTEGRDGGRTRVHRLDHRQPA